MTMTNSRSVTLATNTGLPSSHVLSSNKIQSPALPERVSGPAGIYRRVSTMARPSKNQRSSNPPPSLRPSTFKRRANRLGNSARTDVYEYQSQRVRRAHILLSLDKDEAHEHGAVSDDDTDSNVRKPRLIGENVEDEDIPSEDDEELDSDAAFEESDEERFAGFSFPNVRRSSPFPRITLTAYTTSLGVRPRVKARSGTRDLIPQKLATTMAIVLWIQKRLVTRETSSMSSMFLMAVPMIVRRRRFPRVMPTPKARLAGRVPIPTWR